MLAFDIETFGLDPSKTKISVICTECIFTGERKTFEFAKHDREVGGPPTALTAELVATLDAAQSLSAFNGIRFDLPFIQISLSIPEEKVRAWVLKTTDILEYTRLMLNGCTFKLGECACSPPALSSRALLPVARALLPVSRALLPVSLACR